MKASMTRRWLTGVVAVMLMAAACSSGDDDSSSGGGGNGLDDPGKCTAVDVAASPEKLQLLTDLAESFNGSDAADMGGDHCAFVRIQKKSSGAAEQLLAKGWDEQA